MTYGKPPILIKHENSAGNSMGRYQTPFHIAAQYSANPYYGSNLNKKEYNPLIKIKGIDNILSKYFPKSDGKVCKEFSNIPKNIKRYEEEENKNNLLYSLMEYSCSN